MTAAVSRGSGVGAPRSPEGWALAGFLAFTVVAVVGYGVFGLHPERLPSSAFATRIYQVSFVFFARAQIVASALVLGVALVRHARLRWIPALGAVYLLSFLAEHVGTGYGFPFSGYAYTGMLGPKLLGRVPYLIPLSWFLMAAPSWILARALTGAHGRTVARVALAAALLVVWDLALDPAMSFLAPYWVWERPGAYYGMPWVNLAGWFGTGLALMAALEALDRRLDWAGSLPVRWAAGYYLVVLLMPLGMVAAAGLWGAVAATLLAVAVPAALVASSLAAPRGRDAPHRAPAPLAGETG